MTRNHARAATVIFTAAGSAFAQVSPGLFIAGMIEDSESTLGSRTTFANTLSRDAVVGGNLELISVDPDDRRERRSPGSRIIQFQSGDDGHLAAAVSMAGITPDLVLEKDFSGLIAALDDPDYGVALISNPCCFFTDGTTAALIDFVARGNVVHLSFWDMDQDPELQSLFGLASADDFFDPREVFNNDSHASWGGAASPVTPGGSSRWVDNGDSMTADIGAIVVGTFDSTTGDGAIIIANEGTTLFNGFDYDSMADSEVRDLLAAQLRWLPSPGDPCFADFDEDGRLTIFDFLAFLNAFDLADDTADCDGDGSFTIFDFQCFQQAFDAGCE